MLKCAQLICTACTNYAHVYTHKPVSVPCDDIAIEARCDEETSVGVVLDVFHPAGVAVQRAHLWIQITEIPQCNCGVIRASGKQTIVQKPAGHRH